MKQVIIVLLVIILGIMGYNVYQKNQRFNPTNYEYKPSETIDANHPNKALLLDYYQAVEALNGAVITQWSANSIDVRNPKDDDKQTLAAVSDYNQKLGFVKYFESQLLIESSEEPAKTEYSEEENKKMLVLEMFHANPAANSLRLGEKGALVYEIQRILIQKGDSIKLDGVFSTETFNALKAFEAKHGLLPDGKLDAITLQYLMK
jgi:murein L,D-transpeptidase YcbB/YkuD